jgi:hypothetical protein
MTDILIVQQFEILIINVFGMHIGLIILQVAAITEITLAGSQIGPCLKCGEGSYNFRMSGKHPKLNKYAKHHQSICGLVDAS